jgi:cardiolipin synthase
VTRLKRGRKTWIVAKTFVAAALIVLLVANLSLGDKRIEERVETLYTVADPQFRRTMDVMLGPALLGGNRAQALLNGDQIFGDMLQAIRGARRTITFESYIYWSGEIGAQFTSALAERAKAGVKVHVLFDALGSGKIDDRAVEEMKAAGVEVEKYNPLRWNTLATINNCTHRKIMVVDGRIGYTGGVGIADEWRGNAQDPEHWRDTHFRLEGPRWRTCRPRSWRTGSR